MDQQFAILHRSSRALRANTRRKVCVQPERYQVGERHGQVDLGSMSIVDQAREAGDGG